MIRAPPLVHSPALHLTALASEGTDGRRRRRPANPIRPSSPASPPSSVCPPIAIRRTFSGGAGGAGHRAQGINLRSPRIRQGSFPIEVVRDLIADRGARIAASRKAEAQAKVEAAERAGHPLTGGMRKWATALCSRDPEAFDAFPGGLACTLCASAAANLVRAAGPPPASRAIARRRPDPQPVWLAGGRPARLYPCPARQASPAWRGRMSGSSPRGLRKVSLTPAEAETWNRGVNVEQSISTRRRLVEPCCSAHRPGRPGKDRIRPGFAASSRRGFRRHDIPDRGRGGGATFPPTPHQSQRNPSLVAADAAGGTGAAGAGHEPEHLAAGTRANGAGRALRPGLRTGRRSHFCSPLAARNWTCGANPRDSNQLVQMFRARGGLPNRLARQRFHAVSLWQNLCSPWYMPTACPLPRSPAKLRISDTSVRTYLRRDAGTAGCGPTRNAAPGRDREP